LSSEGYRYPPTIDMAVGDAGGRGFVTPPYCGTPRIMCHDQSASEFSGCAGYIHSNPSESESSRAETCGVSVSVSVTCQPGPKYHVGHLARAPNGPLKGRPQTSLKGCPIHQYMPLALALHMAPRPAPAAKGPALGRIVLKVRVGAEGLGGSSLWRHSALRNHLVNAVPAQQPSSH
jgi:hypothetical protein